MLNIHHLSRVSNIAMSKSISDPHLLEVSAS